MQKALQNTIKKYKDKNYPKLNVKKFFFKLTEEINKELANQNLETNSNVESAVRNMWDHGSLPKDKNIVRALTNILIGPNAQISELFFPTVESAMDYFYKRIRLWFLSEKGLESVLKECRDSLTYFDITRPKYSKSERNVDTKRNLLTSVVLWDIRNHNKKLLTQRIVQIKWTKEKVTQIFEEYLKYIDIQNLETKQSILLQMRTHAESKYKLDECILDCASLLLF